MLAFRHPLQLTKSQLLGFKREKASERTLTVSLKQLKKPANAGFFVYLII